MLDGSAPLEPLRGRSGWLSASALTIEALETPEDHILLAGVRDDGAPLSRDEAMRLLTLPAVDGDPVATPALLADDLNARLSLEAEQIQRAVSERNARFFGEEANNSMAGRMTSRSAWKGRSRR